MTENVARFQVGSKEDGVRLDAFLSRRLSSVTRTQAEKLARAGKVQVNRRPARPGERVKAGDEVEIHLPAPPSGSLAPHVAPLDIAYEDEHLLVVSKPPGLPVHPRIRPDEHTLVQALLAHRIPLAKGHGTLRPGLVHRLDRLTSGLLIVAKTDAAFAELSRQVREREVERRYLALVWGVLTEDRLLVDIPVRRLLEDPTRVAPFPSARPGPQPLAATTDVRTTQRFQMMTLVEAKLLTGRTHQIRVHLNHVGHPVVGDPVYGLRRSRKEKRSLDRKTLALVKALPGQALHAHSLRFRHPISGQELSFSVPPPPALGRLLAHLGRRVV